MGSHTQHGVLDNPGFTFRPQMTIHAFKRNDTPLWSVVPESATFAHGSFLIGPSVISVTCRRMVVPRSCKCCVYLGDYQLQLSNREAAVVFFQQQGALSEDRELLASLQQRDACLVGTLNNKLVGISKRNSIDRLVRELEIYRSLSECHPRTAFSVDFEGAFIDREASGSFLVATQFAPLGDLYGSLSSRKFPLRLAVRIFSQIISGIAVLHSLGFVWRDCKPENILMRDSENVCIADFSLACRADDADLQTSRCGTLGYTAPEILMIPETAVTASCDLWSAGSVLFDLTVGNSLCALFRVTDPAELKTLNREVYCAWKGQRVVSFYSGDRKFKVEFQSELVAELLVGLLDRNAAKRLSCDQALEICNLIGVAFPSCRHNKTAWQVT